VIAMRLLVWESFSTVSITDVYATHTSARSIRRDGDPGRGLSARTVLW
jgi:hypothetical protein